MTSGGEVASSHLDALALQDHAHLPSADAKRRPQLAHCGSCLPCSALDMASGRWKVTE